MFHMFRPIAPMTAIRYSVQILIKFERITEINKNVYVSLIATSVKITKKKLVCIEQTAMALSTPR